MTSIRPQVFAGLVSLSLVVLLFALTERIPQDPAYHRFVDTRSVWSTPNFWNVLSNLPFFLVGLWGLSIVSRDRGPALRPVRTALLVLFAGVTLTAAGSGYYHANPSNETLFWDRLPMSIAFAGLFITVLGLYVSRTAARILLVPVVLLAVSSVIYWRWTEAAGVGDLRPFVIVQFLPMLAIPLILVARGSRSVTTRYLWITLFLYAASKLFEHYDAVVYQAAYLSGHSLKHITAALAIAAFTLGLRRITREHDRD